MSGKMKFVANVERRKWDLAEYEQQAQQEKHGHKDKDRDKDRHHKQVVSYAPLKHRDLHIDLESRVGKYTVITNTTPLAQRGGYYCDICECLLKDSISYLDHINGKKRMLSSIQSYIAL